MVGAPRASWVGQMATDMNVVVGDGNCQGLGTVAGDKPLRRLKVESDEQSRANSNQRERPKRISATAPSAPRYTKPGRRSSKEAPGDATTDRPTL